ncbi:alpha/beta fold hydrolase [Rhizobium sp. PP-CC-3G-465]|uniref:alpha/beta fold hydrolase n=1 Tax=Rhizobium sp. PP-CC-3G-465 TaxID=2135648 RepID=UPI001044F8EA|nr:pimeloyl-ACP methyl ester carboxylesterase [Rhizobium sp. PP-CC-3G-465]
MTHDPIQYAETAFGKLAYRIDGAADAEPLLLLQRFRGTIEDWDPLFIERLARDHKVIRFDNVGVSRSQGETPDNVPDMAKGALALMDAIGLGSVHTLGWSLGGYVAQALALLAPDRVKRLVIAGSGPGAVTEGTQKRHPRVNEIAQKKTIEDADTVFLFSADSDSSRAASQASLDRIAKARTGDLATQATAGAQLQAIMNWSGGRDAARPRLGELTMPILVANGTTDVMVPPYGAFVISQEAPNAKLILYPDSGHGFLFQHIDAFVDELKAFFTA